MDKADLVFGESRSSDPQQDGGFDFENAARNAFLRSSGLRMPKAMKTGTTICGVVYKDGVILGADTRATSDLVVDKRCMKIHYIAPNIYCCGAGTAADTENTTGQISAQLELLRMNTGTQSRVITCLTMLKRYLYRYQGYVSAALVLGGVDSTGPHLYTVYPHGSTDKLPFASMGSGSLAAMSVLESGYKDDMNEEEALKLVSDAIQAGVFNDLGSGSNVNVCVIRKNGEVMLREGYLKLNEKSDLTDKLNLPPTAFSFPPGTTPTVSEDIRSLVDIVEE